MKKCIIFFAFLVLALLLAVLTENKERSVRIDEIVLGENNSNQLLADDRGQEAE
jgi:preprotein translocase subunit SecG